MQRLFAFVLLATLASVANAGVLGSALVTVEGLKLIDTTTGMELVSGVDYLPGAVPTVTPFASDGVYGSTSIVVAGGTVLTGGVNAAVGADINVPDFVPELSDLAVASLTSGISFTALRDLDSVVAQFTGSAAVSVSVFGVDPGIGTALTELTFGISGVSPNTIEFAPPVDFSLTQVGEGSQSEAATFVVSNEFSALALQTVGLTATQSSRVTFSAVPEPASLAAFLLIGGVGAVRRRRRVAC